MTTAPCSHPVHIARLLGASRRVLVAAHAHPDGDALGATAAMGWVLHALDREMILFNATGAPTLLDWLPLPQPLHTDPQRLPFVPDLAVVLDCGDAGRAGELLLAALRGVPTINIDHHLGNPQFGTCYNWVDPGKAAVGQMVAEVAQAAGVPLTGPLAEAVYLALVSDTGGFAFGNTTAAVFRLAADLVDGGLDAAALRERLDQQWSPARMRLWGLLLRRPPLYRRDTVALATVRLEDFTACGALKEDLEGFAEHLRRLRGVLVAGVVREEGGGRCRVSLRSSGPVDVRVVAESFGGGGHRNAAGCTIPLTPAKARDAVLHAVDAMLSAMAAPRTPGTGRNRDLPL